MPEKRTIARARADRRRGKSPSTQAGEFVHEEIEHVRRGKHGARSAKQAIAIGLSKARRAGVRLRPPPKGKKSARTRTSARRALARGRRGGRPHGHGPGRFPGRFAEGHTATSRSALQRQAHRAASKRSANARSRSARSAAQTRKHE